jgi:hypothetical protein
VRLTAGGGTVDLIVATNVGVFRADDGKKVADVPKTPGYEGASILVSGDVFSYTGRPDGTPKVRFAARLALGPSGGEVTELWRTEAHARTDVNTVSDSSNVLLDGVIYSPQTGYRIDLLSGKTSPMAKAGSSYASPILAGRHIYCLFPGEYRRANQVSKQPRPGRAVVISVDTPDQSREISAALADTRMLDDVEFRLRWLWRGNATSMSNASPSAQANRLFYRTAGYLWCIGDPAQPFPVPRGHTATASAPGPSPAAAKSEPGMKPKPSPAPARTVAGKTPSAEAEAKFAQKLIAGTSKAVSSGAKVAFMVSLMRQTMTVKAIDSRGKLTLVRGGMETALDFTRLAADDRKSLAAAVADRNSAEDCAMAAFFHLAAGDEVGAAAYLAGAGALADEVRKAFE